MIDDHGHPFALRGGALDLAAITLFTETGSGAAHRRHEAGDKRLPAHLLARRLARYLGCSLDDVPEARAEASTDWPSYVQGLLGDAGIDQLVLDVGGERHGGVARVFSELTARPVHWLARIDPVIDGLMEAGADAETIVDQVEGYCREAAAAGCCGFKSAVAYRTGLAVTPDVSADLAQRSLAEPGPLRRRGKACRDRALQRAMAVAADTERPFQIHTGFGDSSLRLSESHPLLLEDLLRTEEGSAAAVVLIHGAFPWTEELGYLALSHPNVYAEISLFNIFAPLQVADRLLKLLELVPTDRIVVGTDGHGQPETFWFAAHGLQAAWGQVAVTLQVAGAGPAWIEESRRDLFERTARSLYLG